MGATEPFAPSRAEGPPAPLCDSWQKQEAPHRVVRVGSRSGSHFDSDRLLQKTTQPGWLLGLSLLDWPASIWVAGWFDWTVGLVSGWFSWTVASGLVWGLGRCSWASISRAGLRLGLSLGPGYFGSGWPGSDGSFFLTRLLRNFSTRFISPSHGISVADFDPLSSFPLYFSSFFPSSKFCRLKVSKTTDLRTFRKTQFFDLGDRRRRLWKGTKCTLSYCAIVTDPSRGVNWAFGVGFRGGLGLVREIRNSPMLSEISLSLSLSLSFSLVFSLFSLFAGILIGSESRGLKVERGVAVVSRGIRETRPLLENSRVFWPLSFFFFVFVFFFFFFFFFSGRYIIYP